MGAGQGQVQQNGSQVAAFCGIGPSCREQATCCDNAERRNLKRVFQAYEIHTSLLGPSVLTVEQQKLVQTIVDQQCDGLVRGLEFNVNGTLRRVGLDTERMVLEVSGEGDFPLHKLDNVQMNATWSSYDTTLFFDLASSAHAKAAPIRAQSALPPLRFAFVDQESRLRFALTIRVLRCLSPQQALAAEVHRARQDTTQQRSSRRRSGEAEGRDEDQRANVASIPVPSAVAAGMAARRVEPACSRCGGQPAPCIARPCGCQMCEGCTKTVQELPAPWCVECSSRIGSVDRPQIPSPTRTRQSKKFSVGKALGSNRIPTLSAAAAGVSPSQPKAQDPEGAECVICISAPATMAFVPCGHKCVCAGCAKQLPKTQRRRCPQCRREATDIIKIFG